MKKIELEQNFDCTLEFLLQVRDERNHKLSKSEDFDEVQILEEKKGENVVYKKRKIKLGKKMPELLSSILPSNLTTFINESSFNETSKEHQFTTFLDNAAQDTLCIHGVSRYISCGPDQTKRTYRIEIKSKLFLVGKLIEMAIAEMYKSNLEKDHQSLLLAISKYQKV